MTALDPARLAAAVMRTQVAALRRKLPAGSAARRAAQKGGGRDEPDFASLVAHRVAALDPQDPARDHKAVRIYLESVILAELDSGLARDPAFPAMMDDIHRQMMRDPLLARALAQAAAVLLGRPAGG